VAGIRSLYPKSCASVFLVGMNLRHFRFLGIPYYFVGVAIYRAHRAVTFATAWLSCCTIHPCDRRTSGRPDGPGDHIYAL